MAEETGQVYNIGRRILWRRLIFEVVFVFKLIKKKKSRCYFITHRAFEHVATLISVHDVMFLKYLASVAIHNHPICDGSFHETRQSTVAAVFVAGCQHISVDKHHIAITVKNKTKNKLRITPKYFSLFKLSFSANVAGFFGHISTKTTTMTRGVGNNLIVVCQLRTFRVFLLPCFWGSMERPSPLRMRVIVNCLVWRNVPSQRAGREQTRSLSQNDQRRWEIVSDTRKQIFLSFFLLVFSDLRLYRFTLITPPPPPFSRYRLSNFRLCPYRYYRDVNNLAGTHGKGEFPGHFQHCPFLKTRFYIDSHKKPCKNDDRVSFLRLLNSFIYMIKCDNVVQ